MENKAKDDKSYQGICRVVDKVALEMRNLGQEPERIIVAGVLHISLANVKIQCLAFTVEVMEKVIHAPSEH